MNEFKAYDKKDKYSNKISLLLFTGAPCCGRTLRKRTPSNAGLPLISILSNNTMSGRIYKSQNTCFHWVSLCFGNVQYGVVV